MYIFSRQSLLAMDQYARSLSHPVISNWLPGWLEISRCIILENDEEENQSAAIAFDAVGSDGRLTSVGDTVACTGKGLG